MKKEKIQQFLKRFGLVGFLFFFLKGIAWLVVTYFVGSAII